MAAPSQRDSLTAEFRIASLRIPSPGTKGAVMRRGGSTARRSSAVLAALILASTGGCGDPSAAAPGALAGLHACPGAGDVVGVVTQLGPDYVDEGGTVAGGVNTWTVGADGTLRQLTDDSTHFYPLISPDARTVYQISRSGEIEMDSLVGPDTIERWELEGGAVATIREYPEILDISLSADGRFLAVAHAIADPMFGVSVLDLDAAAKVEPVVVIGDGSGYAGTAAPVALSPDGGQLAYGFHRLDEVRGTVFSSVRLLDLATGKDSLLTDTNGKTVTDLVWSADGATVIVGLNYLPEGGTVETPLAFEILRLDPSSGQIRREDGFTFDISPISLTGDRLIGFGPSRQEGDIDGKSLIVFGAGEVSAVSLSLDFQPRGIDVAECSYK